MVTVQMLSEVEEIVEYKQNPDRREGIRQAWWERLQVSIYELHGHNTYCMCEDG
jgi:metal-responsive CopG/Arc/MetJ family transcriptional regulator